MGHRSPMCVGYEGDTPVCTGSIDDIARYWGVTRETVRFYYSSAYERRTRRVPDRRLVVRVAEEDDDGEA